MWEIGPRVGKGYGRKLWGNRWIMGNISYKRVDYPDIPGRKDARNLKLVCHPTKHIAIQNISIPSIPSTVKPLCISPCVELAPTCRYRVSRFQPTALFQGFAMLAVEGSCTAPRVPTSSTLY